MDNRDDASSNSSSGQGDGQSDKDDHQTKEARDVRASLQMAILQIVITQDRIHRTRTDTGAVRALTELVYQYATNRLAPDLYQFSNHANRKSTITVDDVALVLRKVPHLQEQFMENVNATIRSPKTKDLNPNRQRSNSRTENTESATIARPKSSERQLLLSSSSSSDDEVSINLPNKNSEKRRPIAFPRARSTSSSLAKRKEAPLPPVALKKKKKLSTVAETAAALDNLLNDSSSSDDGIPDFMKRKTPAKAATSAAATTASRTDLEVDSTRSSPPRKSQSSSPKRKLVHQSQVMDILNSYSSDSGLSSDGPNQATKRDRGTKRSPI